MPSGRKEVHANSMTFPSATRHDSGIYICSADNGFGDPATAEVILDVQRKLPFDNLLVALIIQQSHKGPFIKDFTLWTKRFYFWRRGGGSAENTALEGNGWKRISS